MEAELSKLSMDGERGVMAEMERLDTEHRQQTASRCDEIQQQLARLTELTERCHGDSVAEMTSALNHQQQQILTCADTVSVLRSAPQYYLFLTGPPNGPVLFCSLASVVCRRLSSLFVVRRLRRLSASSVVVCNAAGWRAGWPPGAWAVGRPTLHGGPVRLLSVRATPCLFIDKT